MKTYVKLRNNGRWHEVGRDSTLCGLGLYRIIDSCEILPVPYTEICVTCRQRKLGRAQVEDDRPRNCFHFREECDRDINTDREMCDLAKKERRYDIKWGVVNSGNALCAQIFETKREADNYRRQHARAYSVIRVAVTPLYTRWS